MKDDFKIGIIGCGKMGGNLAWSLSAAGYRVVGVSSQNGRTAQDVARRLPDCQYYESNQQLVKNIDLVFLAVPDDAIQAVCGGLSWNEGQYVLHCSGVHTAAILDNAAACGAEVGVFHPLQSFVSRSDGYDYFKGTALALEASGSLLHLMREMGTLLGGNVISVPPSFKALYHASAVMSANYTVVLAGIASQLWANWGISAEDAARYLLPLIKNSVANMERIGISQSLTGPISRGDTHTLIQNLAALRQYAPEYQSLYCELGVQAIKMAFSNGTISADDAIELENTLLAAGYRKGAL